MDSLRSKLMLILLICGSILAVIALSQSAYAGGECASLGGACDDGGWDPMAKLDEIGNVNAGQEQNLSQVAGEVERDEMEYVFPQPR